MIKLEEMTEFGRKQWVKRKYDEYTQTPNTKAIDRSVKMYNDPTNRAFDEHIDKAKWKTTVDKKVNYLLARKPICTGHQELLDSLSDLIKETAKQFTLRGSLIWIVQGDGENVDPQPSIFNNAIAIYKDETKQEPLCFIRKYTDIEIVPETGEEQEINYYECYYGTKRDVYRYDQDNKDVIGEELGENAPTFIELGSTGDAALFAYVEALIAAFDHVLKHQDTTVVKNTTPITEVRGYSGTSDEDLDYAVNRLNIVKTDGNGGLTIHTRSMDSTSIDLWVKRLLEEYYSATCTVGKDNELAFAQSGKAMDRLFIDMENSAKELAHTLEQAILAYFQILGIEDADIIWNTDRPVDDTDIINGIVASTGILSKRTLLEMHPWVEDVDEELRRLASEESLGMEDLTEQNINNEEEEY